MTQFPVNYTEFNKRFKGYEMIECTACGDKERMYIPGYKIEKSSDGCDGNICQYCGTGKQYESNCIKCGAPL